VRRDRRARSFEKLANAVLRKLASQLEADGMTAEALLASVPPAANLAGWQRKRWTAAYGAPAVEQIAASLTMLPPLDLVMREAGTAPEWAERLGGSALSGNVVRLATTNVEQLDGYGDGAWWVQDYAATLPARLLAPQAGERIADLCAAPGGKTAQLCAAGAQVTAVDSSPRRTEVLAANMARLKMSPEIVAADIRDWAPEHAGAFDAVLIDAPCTATGTIRRHPDILRRSVSGGDEKLADLQAELLAHAAGLVRPGGRLVFATCSMDISEGPAQIEAFLAANTAWSSAPVSPCAREQLLSAADQAPLAKAGLRTLPFMSPPLAGSTKPVAGGMDGFFISRLEREA
ncbi:MAG: RsmB/NOP family class I SAM-dependent RNA methyltransferase, partial [Pseudomonadota bacterium]